MANKKKGRGPGPNRRKTGDPVPDPTKPRTDSAAGSASGPRRMSDSGHRLNTTESPPTPTEPTDEPADPPVPG